MSDFQTSVSQTKVSESKTNFPNLFTIMFGVFLVWFVIFQVGMWWLTSAQLKVVKAGGDIITEVIEPSPGVSQGIETIEKASEPVSRMAGMFIGFCGAGVATGGTFILMILWSMAATGSQTEELK